MELAREDSPHFYPFVVEESLFTGIMYFYQRTVERVSKEDART